VGDGLTCYVTFTGSANLTSVAVEFSSREKDGGNCVLRESRRLNDRTYEVSGTIKQCPAGTYTLADVTAVREKAFRLYQAGFGLHTDIMIEIEKAPVVEKPQPIAVPTEQKGFRTGHNGPQRVAPCRPDLRDIEAIGSAVPNGNGFIRLLGRVVRKNGCGGIHRPGDSLTCYLRFADDAELSGLSISFDTYQLESAVPYSQRPRDQRGLCGGFLFDGYKKIDSRTYQVSGLLPECRSARYLLSEVTAFGVDGLDRCPSREYLGESAVKKPVVLRLKNSHQTRFPELKEVSATLSESSTR
jgi:hypothetical protein